MLAIHYTKRIDVILIYLMQKSSSTDRGMMFTESWVSWKLFCLKGYDLGVLDVLLVTNNVNLHEGAC
jgi:hypothetical protein